MLKILVESGEIERKSRQIYKLAACLAYSSALMMKVIFLRNSFLSPNARRNSPQDRTAPIEDYSNCHVSSRKVSSTPNAYTAVSSKVTLIALSSVKYL
jgi:hypothetical protein